MKSGGTRGRLFAGLFFALILVMALFFFGFVCSHIIDAAKTRSWQPADCVITHSEVGGVPGPDFRVEIAFEYEFEGLSYSSENYTLHEHSDEDYRGIAAIVAKYPLGSTAVCHVNSDSPSEAVLVHESLLFGVVIIAPLVFVAVGGLGLYFKAFNRYKEGQIGEPRAAVTQSGKRGLGRRHRAFMLLLGGVFLAFGSVSCIFMGVRPLMKVVAARNWVETPCKIISSRVESKGREDKYRINVFYEYEYDQVVRRSSQYAFLSFYSRGRDSKQQAITRYRQGLGSVCYVNPSDPSEAVLERGLISGYLLGLFGLLFILMGAGVLWITFRSDFRRASTARQMQRNRTLIAKEARYAANGWLPNLPVAETSPVALRPIGRWTNFTGMLAFSLVWNGLLGIFIHESLTSWNDGNGDIGMTIVLIPFVLIGLWTIGKVVYYALAISNPRTHLQVSRQIVSVGGSFDLEWRFSRQARLFCNIVIELVGREEVTYAHGTSASTDERVFCLVTLAFVKHPLPNDVGRVTVTLPGNVMHTFESENNKIVWRIVVRGAIRRRPDVKDEFPIVVLPAEYV